MTANNSETHKTAKKPARKVFVDGIDVTDRVVDSSVRPERVVVTCLDEHGHSDWRQTEGKEHTAPNGKGPCQLAVRGLVRIEAA